MWHTLFIALHAASGVVAFVAGCFVVRRPSYFPVYFWSLVLLGAFVVVSLSIAWSDLEQAARWIFAGLVVLAGYMVLRGWQAGRLLPATGTAPSARFLDHLGFTLIALFEGFVIVLAIDLGAPVWLTVALAVAGVVAGHLTFRRLKSTRASA